MAIILIFWTPDVYILISSEFGIISHIVVLELFLVRWILLICLIAGVVFYDKEIDIHYRISFILGNHREAQLNS